MRKNLHICNFCSNFAAQNCVNRSKSDDETGGDSGSGGVHEGVVTRLLCAVLECNRGVVDGAWNRAGDLLLQSEYIPARGVRDPQERIETPCGESRYPVDRWG